MFDPESADRVFHHVPDDPVWCKELSYRRDLFLGDLAILCESFILQLGIVILIQPADNLHLTAQFDIEIFLRNIVHQMPNHAIVVDHGEI